MLIANPLYDVVFKYMLEDEKVAKIFLSAIIGEKIEELDFAATERTTRVQKNRKIKLEHTLTVCRFDFVAKIKTDQGYKTVSIELQKAKYSSDIVRFRKYLGKHYESRDNIYDKENQKTRQIYTVYFLNYGIDLPDCPVISVDYTAKDVTTGKTVNTDNEFIKSLHHKSWIVQMRQLKKRRRNDLEKLLAIFGQGAEEELQHFLNIQEDEVPEEYYAVIRRLLKAQGNEQLRGAMELEDEIIEELRIKERKNEKLIETVEEDKKTIEKKDMIIEEKDKTIVEKNKAIVEKNKAIVEKDKTIVAKDKAIVAKDKTIVEKDKTIEEKDKTIEEKDREIAELKKLLQKS